MSFHFRQMKKAGQYEEALNMALNALEIYSQDPRVHNYVIKLEKRLKAMV